MFRCGLKSTLALCALFYGTSIKPKLSNKTDSLEGRLPNRMKHVWQMAFGSSYGSVP